MIKRFLIGAVIGFVSYWAGFLTAALMSARKEDTDVLDRMACPKCGGWIYLKDDRNGYCDTCDTYLIDGKLYGYGDGSGSGKNQEH